MTRPDLSLAERFALALLLDRRLDRSRLDLPGWAPVTPYSLEGTPAAERKQKRRK